MNWIKELRTGEKSYLWKDFKPASNNEIKLIENTIGQSLPEDFSDFYRHIGYGNWPRSVGGDIYSPTEILITIGAPIFFVLGSLTNGKEWATKSQHRDLWLSKGEINPDPVKFSDEVLNFHGNNLLDLLQIGTDGSAGYQMLNLDSTSKTKYLIIFESSQIDLASETFQEGILRITDWLIN